MLEDLDELNVPRYYALAAIFHIGEEGMGRRKLADSLGLTESKTRTMLDHLRSRGYVETGEEMHLASSGEQVYRRLKDHITRITPVRPYDITVAEQNIAAHLHGAGIEVGSGVEIRDEAVRAGAGGMTVLVYKQGFQFPDGGGENGEDAGALDELEAQFPGAEEGDLLLISSSGARKEAVAGLWRSLFFLFDQAVAR